MSLWVITRNFFGMPGNTLSGESSSGWEIQALRAPPSGFYHGIPRSSASSRGVQMCTKVSGGRTFQHTASSCSPRIVIAMPTSTHTPGYPHSGPVGCPSDPISSVRLGVSPVCGIAHRAGMADETTKSLSRLTSKAWLRYLGDGITSRKTIAKSWRNSKT